LLATIDLRRNSIPKKEKHKNLYIAKRQRIKQPPDAVDPLVSNDGTSRIMRMKLFLRGKQTNKHSAQ
jgi:hypothetical protein